MHFMDNVLNLHAELTEKTYRHGPYHPFKINDPKPRDIHKANVRDRLVHHAICRILYPYFDKQFIHDSYSCRIGKGTHRAMDRLRYFVRKASKNHTRTAWVLKCDIRKFFANIDHEILKNILRWRIKDGDILWLLEQVIDSFHVEGKANIGLPLGNVTSQLLVNIYMNDLDQFLKRQVKTRFYIRYSDDFVILHEDKRYLIGLIPIISEFLQTQLHLELHPKKVSIETLASGVDFLGWVHFPNHRIPRTATKNRMLKHLRKNKSPQTLASYLGSLSHGNTFELAQSIQAPKNQSV